MNVDQVQSTRYQQSESMVGLSWHKPEVQQLVVTLDTAFEAKTGSAADAGTFDRLPITAVD